VPALDFLQSTTCDRKQRLIAEDFRMWLRGGLQHLLQHAFHNRCRGNFVLGLRTHPRCMLKGGLH